MTKMMYNRYDKNDVRGGFMENFEKRAMLVNLMIKHLRQNRKLTQKQLGDLIGVSQRVIWRYEQPGYKVSPETLIKLCYVFGCSMTVIFGYTQHPAKFEALKEMEELINAD